MSPNLAAPLSSMPLGALFDQFAFTCLSASETIAHQEYYAGGINFLLIRLPVSTITFARHQTLHVIDSSWSRPFMAIRGKE